MNSQNTLALGIDFGGTSVKLGIVQEGRLIERLASLPTTEYRHADELLAAILGSIKSGKERYPAVAAIGAGVPGLVDMVRGVVHEMTNVPGWNEIALRDLLAAGAGLPAFVDNDANAMGFAEWKFGAGRGRRNVVCVTLGTGVGGALILDGKLFRGSQFGAGEIGQMAVDPQNRAVTGHYGNFGALEQMVGHNQIAARAGAFYARAGQLRPVADCGPRALEIAALAGDEIARELWRETGELIGFVLADIIWLLNPDAIIIGGGVAKAGDLLFHPIRETIRCRTSPVFHEQLIILPAELGNDAGIIGAATLALENAALEQS